MKMNAKTAIAIKNATPTPIPILESVSKEVFSVPFTFIGRITLILVPDDEVVVNFLIFEGCVVVIIEDLVGVKLDIVVTKGAI